VIAAAVELLRCPHCGDRLAPAPGALACASGHSFDVARQGYASLLSGGASTGTADDAEMVAAREAFLTGGAYAPIVGAIAEEAARSAPREGCVVDLGGGTGHYLAAVLDRLPDRLGLSLDLSKHASRRAAKAHPRAAAVVCDAWRELPVGDAVAAVVLSVFSPRNPGEIARVLGSDGVLVVVMPTDRHLAELIPALGLLSVDERKRERLDEKLRSRFSQAEETAVEYPMLLDRAAVSNLVAMGPSSYHLDADATRERIQASPPLTEVTASVTVSVFRAAQR
jgi:23S rRNA (guanine745-N1)-methyltransferase